jgi:hypothetical protein
MYSQLKITAGKIKLDGTKYLHVPDLTTPGPFVFADSPTNMLEWCVDSGCIHTPVLLTEYTIRFVDSLLYIVEDDQTDGVKLLDLTPVPPNPVTGVPVV